MDTKEASDAFEEWFDKEVERGGPAWLQKAIYDVARAAWERRGQWDKEH